MPYWRDFNLINQVESILMPAHGVNSEIPNAREVRKLCFFKELLYTKKMKEEDFPLKHLALLSFHSIHIVANNETLSNLHDSAPRRFYHQIPCFKHLLNAERPGYI